MAKGNTSLFEKILEKIDGAPLWALLLFFLLGLLVASEHIVSAVVYGIWAKALGIIVATSLLALRLRKKWQGWLATIADHINNRRQEVKRGEGEDGTGGDADGNVHPLPAEKKG